MKKYILCERSFGYNDESYYPEDGYNPKLIITDKEVAKQQCLEKNIQFLKKNPHLLSSYSYELRRFENEDGPVFTDQQLDEMEYGECNISSFSDDLLKEIVIFLKSPFLKILEVEEI